MKQDFSLTIICSIQIIVAQNGCWNFKAGTKREKKSKSEEGQKTLRRIRRMKQAGMLIGKEWSSDPIAAFCMLPRFIWPKLIASSASTTFLCEEWQKIHSSWLNFKSLTIWHLGESCLRSFNMVIKNTSKGGWWKLT